MATQTFLRCGARSMRASLLLVIKPGSCVLFLSMMACAPTATPIGVVWTNGEDAPAPGAERRASSSAPVAQEPYVPRVRCNDGSLSATCSRVNMSGDCCANQGGLYHDPWGNLVFE